MNTEALSVLKNVTRTDDFRVLMALLEKLDFQNTIAINQTDIGRDLGMAPPQVNRAISRLIKLGALIPGPKTGVNRAYRLNPHFGWKGSAKSHIVALDSIRKKNA